jgi:hypothetical protein
VIKIYLKEISIRAMKLERDRLPVRGANVIGKKVYAQAGASIRAV